MVGGKEPSWQDVLYMYEIPWTIQIYRCNRHSILTTRYGATLNFRKIGQKEVWIGGGQGAIVARRPIHVRDPLDIPNLTVQSAFNSDHSLWSYTEL